MDIPESPPHPAYSFFADEVFDRVEQEITSAEQTLKPGENLEAFYVTGSERIRVANLGYHNPTLIVLRGQDLDGRDCVALVSAFAFHLILKTVPAKPGTPRRQIGFQGDLSGTDAAHDSPGEDATP